MALFLDDTLMTSLLTPISGKNPSGEDTKYDDDYGWIESEYAKAGKATLAPSPDGGSAKVLVYETVDWEGIADKASALLANKTKDLRIVSYLMRAVAERDGLAGFCRSLKLSREIMDTFWETLFPLARAREAAVERWSLMLQEYIDSADPKKQATPITEAELKQGNEQLAAIREGLGKRIDNYNVVVKLQSCEKRLDTIISQLPKAAPPPAPAPASPTPASIQTSAISSTSSDSGPAASSSVTTTAAPRPPLNVSGGSLGELLKELGEPVKKLIEAGVAAETLDSSLFRFSRVVRWSALVVPATGTVLPIGGPRPETQAAIRQSAEKQDWRELFARCEKNFAQFPAWLDLQRYSWIALTQIGEAGTTTSDAIAQEVRFLLRRFPQLSSFRFSDSLPLADADTKEWLSDILAGGDTIDTASRPGHDRGATEGGRDAASELVFDSAALADSLGRATTALNAAGTGEAGFRIRIRIASFLITEKQYPLALGYVRSLDELMTRHQLEAWNPELAAEAICQHYLCLLNLSKLWKEQAVTLGAQSRELMQRLAVIKPAKALELSLLK